MKIPFKIISSILLFVCAIFAMWIGASKLIIITSLGGIHLGNILGIVDIVVAIILIASGYSTLRRNLENGLFVALFTGFIFTIWYYMRYEINLALIFEGIVPVAAGLMVLPELKNTTKRIWYRRIKGFWEDFSHNKIGLVGLGIILIYVIVAFTQPILATNDPDQTGLAEKYAMPEWITFFNPALGNLPRTTDYTLDWQWNNASLPAGVTINWTMTSDGKQWAIRYQGNESVVVPIYLKYNYPYDVPTNFYYQWTWGAQPALDALRKGTARYSLELNLTAPNGRVIPVWDQHWWRYKAATCMLPNPYYKPGVNPPEMYWYPGGQDPLVRKYGYQYYYHYKENIWDANYTLQPCYIVYEKWGIPIPTWEFSSTKEQVHYTTTQYTPMRLGYEADETNAASADLFSSPGEYTMTFYVAFESTKPNIAGSCEVTMSDFKVHVPGRLWGLLGTEEYGRDVWSRLIWGTRVSLAVGLAAAIISVSVGVLIGLVAGYYGGFVDEVLMRVVDILLCLPLLPILMLLITMLQQRSILYIVLLIAVFGWQGLARMVRSQVLSLREMPFVECAVASGASRPYIIFKHLLPNVMPIALSDLVLSVPSAILLEAALSFIGFGDISTPTWGREYAMMQIEGANPSDAWWWMLPPGIAITILCVGFVFLGHAIDEIVNPRLRRRR
jgi:ABC-type dipeptide/oligopeptide/nickel transport system permease subunit